jgi:hypothetical protein
VLFASVVPSAMLKNTDGSVISSLIVPGSFPLPHPFSRPSGADYTSDFVCDLLHIADAIRCNVCNDGVMTSFP